MSVRVRMPPSPSGDVHVGNARTALFNWLFARKNGGKFVLRIEDTDSARSSPEAIQAIQESLSWLGLDWDEGPGKGGPFGPYVQSERMASYQGSGQALLAAGKAYWCFSTAEELEQESRVFRESRRKVAHPDRLLTPAQQDEKRTQGRKPSLRFIVPQGPGEVVFQDLIRGEIRVSLDELNDFNLLRSDGRAMYDFAVVNDDHAMEISHVLRGEDGISNTPRQVLLYQALGWTPPLFGHVSFILGPDHTKLSKSHGSTSIGEFRRQGYLPEALLNYLGLLGLGGRAEGSEILGLPQLLEAFSFENLVKSPAVFDYGKLNFLNAHYLRAKPGVELARLARPYLEEAGIQAAEERLMQALEIVKGNAQLLSDLPGQLGYLFGKEPHSRPEALQALAGSTSALNAFKESLGLGEYPTGPDPARSMLKTAQVASGLKGKEFFMPLRLALCGMEHGPELVNLLPLMDKTTCLRRVESALAAL